ncbi:MAG: DUF3757 domain-containing protein [Gammaproteobacteria bacterium]
MLKALSFIILLLSSTSLFAAHSNANCPNLDEIKRTSGEYSWISYAPGWSGAFAFPQQGKGSSTHVAGFIEARWIQLTNLEDSQGYFECDYRGNYDGEIIRFVQAGTRANKKPTDNHWSCQLNPSFPGVQCICSMSTERCVMETIDNSAPPTPIYIDPSATEPLPSPPDINHYRDK